MIVHNIHYTYSDFRSMENVPYSIQTDFIVCIILLNQVINVFLQPIEQAEVGKVNKTISGGRCHKHNLIKSNSVK